MYNLELEYSHSLETWVIPGETVPVRLVDRHIAQYLETSGVGDKTRMYKLDGFDVICQHIENDDWSILEIIGPDGIISDKVEIAFGGQLHHNIAWAHNV